MNDAYTPKTANTCVSKLSNRGLSLALAALMLVILNRIYTYSKLISTSLGACQP